ncbi:hypothetical protein K443DRAFT_675232 [Laccaria amethystina LaAM-08-1]|uniref:Mid2 domain-containing protein n=1 Tax=Laccaria amethystina LaAM-08-1 TaxID=1095629 RepID=A0A0C9XJP6_9AGAR|nr:hypothetical protein K443DRAFT_675232 [Laccaria amethystina LaAM-08-1]
MTLVFRSDTQVFLSSSIHDEHSTASSTSTRTSAEQGDASKTKHFTSIKIASVTSTQKASHTIPVVSPTSTPQSSSINSKAANLGVVVATVLAAIAVLGFLMVAFFHFRRRRRKSSRRRPVVAADFWDPRPFNQKPTVCSSTAPHPPKVDPDYPSVLKKDSILSRNPSSASTRSSQLHYKKSRVQLQRSASLPRHYMKTVHARHKSNSVDNPLLARSPSTDLPSIRELKDIHAVQDVVNNESQIGIILQSTMVDDVWDGRVRVNLSD